jgi:hypothetical protein
VSSLTAVPVDQNPIGYFRIFATPPGGTTQEITIFRGAPITIDNAATADPFTDTTASLTCPQITVFDTPGTGDLDWLVPDCDIDIVWENYGSYDYKWRWEGFLASYDFNFDPSNSGFRIDLKGALFGLDDYLAIPKFPRRPIPYEILIKQAFSQLEHPARLKELKVSFPADWKTVVPEYKSASFIKDHPEFTIQSYIQSLKPSGVTTGQKWSGLASRNTGSWEPVLSGFVQSLLSTMFDEGSSQWTIRNTGLRTPELYLRRPPKPDDGQILEITLGAPGVGFSGSRDFTQRANVIYGQGKDEAGITYSGMAVSPDGSNTYFEPYAWSPLTYPRTNNPSRDKFAKAKETMIRFQDGLDEIAATRVAQAQLQRFTDPGIAGTITLNSDPRTADGKPFPRMLIKAGRTFRIKNLLGINEGLLVHVTQATVNFADLSVSLTVDSKYRDVLTVDEVRARTRDALSPLRALQVGKFSNTINDLLYPWSYKEGSGMVPSSSKDFFLDKLPKTASFPYEEFTRRYPPRKYPNYYIKIGPTDKTNSTNNWCGVPRKSGSRRLALPVRMSQAGAIRLSQIAAYDKDGNVLPVRFHVSLYKINGVGPDAMPKFPSDFNFGGTPRKWLKPTGVAVNYEQGQRNPFFENAWEKVTQSGVDVPSADYLTATNADVIVGWGNYFEPAGYSPGRFSRGADRTGLLEDTTTWEWNNSDLFDPQGVNLANVEEAGSLFIEIFCDEQGDEPVFFQGRFFRVEPGTQ